MFDLGDTWGLGADLRDSNGVLVAADTVTLIITKPDLTEVDPAPVVDAPDVTGEYGFLFVPDAPGRWTARWLFELDGVSTVVTQEINVAPADPGGILSLADAKEHLNIDSQFTDFDEELRFWIAVMTAVIERDPEFGVGAVVVREFTQPVDNGPYWMLWELPVVELLSATPTLTGGQAVDVDDLHFESLTGQVLRLDGGRMVGGPWDLTYRAGFSLVPTNVLAAARVVLQDMWETQRGDGGRGTQFGQSTAAAVLDYAMPKRARLLLAPHRRISGVA